MTSTRRIAATCHRGTAAVHGDTHAARWHGGWPTVHHGPAHGTAVVHGGSPMRGSPSIPRAPQNSSLFERGFQSFREMYRNTISWALCEPKVTVVAFARLMMGPDCVPQLGRDLPQSMRVKCACSRPRGTRNRVPRRTSPQVRRPSASVGDDQINT